MGSILTPQQQLALKLIADTNLANHFYFGGDTVLSYYYLHHRYSEDLDFFSQEEFNPQDITISIKSLQKRLRLISNRYIAIKIWGSNTLPYPTQSKNIKI